jgi:hypothetical protein
MKQIVGTTTWLLALAAVSLTAGASGAATGATGILKGATQISFGCPGPVSTSGPPCNPWRPFPRARFSLARRSTAGTPVPGTAVVVTSTAQARFNVRLDAGTYIVTPLPQRNTRGGPRLTIRVRAGAATTALVRFLGFPQMA